MGDAGRKCTRRYDIRTDILISGQSAYANKKLLSNPAFTLPPELASWGRRLSAESAVYGKATHEHPAGYLLTGVKQPAKLAEIRTVSLDNEPVLFSPADTA